MMIKLKAQSAKRKVKAQNLKFLVLSFSFAFFILHFTLTCFAQPISSAELINNAKFYDGKTIAYEGEVIGDVMLRNDYAWVNVNDGNNAIGIWIKASLAKDIAYKGSYKAKGDWIEIIGTLQRACVQHGGDLDIHALSIKRIRPGRDISEQLIPGKKNLALILFAILCLVWILKILKRR